MKLSAKFGTLFVLVIAAELFVIAFLGIGALRDRSFLGFTASIIPIKTSDVLPRSDGGLKHFFEPKPNTVQSTAYFDWLRPLPRYTINSDALNERFDYSPGKPEGVFRIVTLGDSFTFGLTVDTGKNYPETLEDLLNRDLRCRNSGKLEVINLGVGGYDIRYSVERFRVRGVKYNPDLVIWFLNRSDFDQIAEIIIPKLNPIWQSSQFLDELIRIDASRHFKYPAKLRAIDEMLEEFGKQNIHEYLKAALRGIDEYYEGRLVLFSIPSLAKEHMSIIDDFVRSRPDAVFHETEVDIYKAGFYQPDGHPNAQGYKVIAEDVFNYLARSGMIPCGQSYPVRN